MHLLTHPTRRTGPSGTDMDGIYRNMVLFDFQTEVHSGFFVAYYRNFAIPTTARTLATTGEMKSRPMKRSYDTGIVIYEIIANGFEHERSQAMIELLRRVHKGVPGTPDDFVYVLMTLLVLPLRWTERHGWRRLTELEKRAAMDFYAELGRQMGLEGVPATFAEAEQFLDEYEDRNMGPSPEGAMLLNATAAAFARRIPTPLRRFTPTILALMMDKPQVAVALGLKPAPAALRVPFNAVLRFRALKARRRPLPTKPIFVPGGRMSAYADGYTLDQIGPQATV
ncbi:oxygenase MpaB family protein [Arthrobacter sp. ES3-54]|uniref:oxygenase MpaB family protein n=1 Tax=Arthrobacter sp. ES3-54 TaxID=1502991 RepID=UPI0024068C6C|nr:oxygenase MpaB family protein [Arthrobacter sp. ES3-54]MDF9752544.1 hypothetical protein [Arthrobacter sp. ES3-54]